MKVNLTFRNFIITQESAVRCALLILFLISHLRLFIFDNKEGIPTNQVKLTLVEITFHVRLHFISYKIIFVFYFYLHSFAGRRLAFSYYFAKHEIKFFMLRKKYAQWTQYHIVTKKKKKKM